MSQFIREPRYIVIKIKDAIRYLNEEEQDSLMNLGMIVAGGRYDDKKLPFNAAVVEQDWPEFEMVWAAIEARMAGEPNEITNLRARLFEMQTAAIDLNTQLEEQKRAGKPQPIGAPARVDPANFEFFGIATGDERLT